MTEIVLDGAGVVPIVGEREAAWRSMCGWAGKGRAAAASITAGCLLNPAAVIGEWRSVVNR